MSGTLSIADSGQVTDETVAATASEAAVIDLGDLRSNVDVFVDVSGAADLTVEVSTTGEFAGEERQADTNSYGAAATDFRQYDLAYRYVRAYASANVNIIEVVGRGL